MKGSTQSHTPAHQYLDKIQLCLLGGDEDHLSKHPEYEQGSLLP
jgi:hypothetical protein